jgi:hypothetical protein
MHAVGDAHRRSVGSRREGSYAKGLLRPRATKRETFSVRGFYEVQLPEDPCEFHCFAREIHWGFIARCSNKNARIIRS